jgi:hypothetical protein
MRVGSWREVDESAYARGALFALGLTVVSSAMPVGLGWFVLGPVLGGCFAAFLMRHRGGAAASSAHSEQTPHRGPNSSRVPVAGIPGLALVVGFVWMFWSGVPIFRPLVIAIAIVGTLAGGILILLERRLRVASSTILNITSRSSQAPVGSDAEPH